MPIHSANLRMRLKAKCRLPEAVSLACFALREVHHGNMHSNGSTEGSGFIQPEDERSLKTRTSIVGLQRRAIRPAFQNGEEGIVTDIGRECSRSIPSTTRIGQSLSNCDAQQESNNTDDAKYRGRGAGVCTGDLGNRLSLRPQLLRCP